MRVIAIIPAKGHSGRVPQKNFRPFHDDQSLLDLKIKQCRRSEVFDAIYVSSDVETVQLTAQNNNVDFLLRDPRFCLDETPWSETLCGILKQIPEPDSTLVAWCPPTSPIFDRFYDAVKTLAENSEYDSLMTVTRMQHYFLGPDLLPLNFQFGVWASFSQKLRPIYQMNCALWLAPKALMMANRFQTGDSPYFMETGATEGIDIDTMEEFELAQIIYSRKINCNNP